jgi:predicted DNA-binding transcriptional regulator AlpA
MTMTQSALRTEDETAARLNMKPQTLARWRVEGRGPRYVKCGRAVRYRDADIEQFIEERVRDSTSQAPRRPRRKRAA